MGGRDKCATTPVFAGIWQHLALEVFLVYGLRYLNKTIRLGDKHQLLVEGEIGEKIAATPVFRVAA